MLLGLIPRLWALAWLVMVGFAPTGTPVELALAGTASGVLLLGGGYGSLLQPEERWFFGRHGGQAATRPPAVHTTTRY